MKKVRKFAQGGTNINDDVRARAMRFLQGETELSGKYHSSEDKPAPTKKPPTPSRSAPAPVLISKQRAPAYSRPRVKGEPAKDLGITQEAVSRDQDQFSPRFGSDTYAKALNVLRERGIGYDRNQATLDALQNAISNEQKTVQKKSGGMVSSASKRADGIAKKGKTRGKVY
jgi:hypothetical protein